MVLPYGPLSGLPRVARESTGAIHTRQAETFLHGKGPVTGTPVDLQVVCLPGETTLSGVSTGRIALP